MNFNDKKRKLSKDEFGVSEVIGNILILMITVILFTSIIAFVNSMPMPEQETKASFVADLIFTDQGTKANLSLRHAGGAVLNAVDTMVLIQKDGVMNPYYLSNDSGLAGATKWNTGGVWKKEILGTTYSSVITVSVIDTLKKNQIWSSQVTGGMGDNPPAILQRWTDSDPNTPSADPVRDGDDFVFYATVSDIDGDLDTTKVWIDAHEFPHSSAKWKWQEMNGNVFRWNFDYINSSKIYAYQLDGGHILIHAEDSKGHVSESVFTMVVTKLPYQPLPPEDDGGWYDLSGLDLRYGRSSGPLGCSFDIFGENSSTGRVNLDDARTNFTKDELVFVEVEHRFMSNAISLNSFSIKNTVTGRSYAPDYRGASSPAQPFYILKATGTTYFECQFNTSNLQPGSYLLNVSMSSLSTAGAPVSFHIEPSITISQANSTITFLPELRLFKTDSYLIPWGGDKMHSFNVSQGTYMVYAALKVLDAQGSPNPACEDIRISDMSGGSQLYGKPPSGTMIPNPITYLNSTWYKFNIDLRYNNGNQWLSGVSSYSLKMTTFADLNEGVYSLTIQVFINAITGKSDFFVGEDGINVGHSNFDVKGYLTYIENNNFFTTQTLFSYTNTPSDKTTYATTALAFGDLTGDGARDILIGQDGTYSLLYYKNSMNTYGGFQDPSMIKRPPTDSATVIRWISCGDINGDGATDFVYASAANKVVVYYNTYGMEPWIYKDYGATVVKKVLLRDMTGDGKADIITLAGGRIYVQDLAKYSPTNPYPVVAKIPDVDTITSGITDFDVADMNADGMLDILTAGAGGDASVNGVWSNNYTISTTPIVKKVESMWVNAGTQVTGNMASLNAPGDSNSLQMQENLTGGSPPTGRVNITFQFPTLDATDTNQLLSVVAKIAPPPGGETEEVFYAWYSVDSNLATAKFIPMFAISNKDAYVNYTFRMPSMASGKAIFLRFTDSSTDPTGGLVPDCLDIDYVSVLANTYGKYYSLSAAPHRYQVVSSTPIAYTCVRAGNITGHSGHLDVVVARNAYWAAYDHTVMVSGFFESGNANFYVQSTNTLMANTAPTLFDVRDINGDGLSDILVCYKTTVQNTISQVGYYMNLHPDKIFYTVSELGRTGGAGSITIARAMNLLGQ